MNPTFEHPFFLKTKREQKTIQFKIVLFSLLVLLVIGIIVYYLNLGFLIWILISLSLTIIAPFFDVPAQIKSGQLIYYSSLFIVEKEKKGMIYIHGGTLFDYFFVFDKNTKNAGQSKFVLKKYLEGILNLISEYEVKDKNKTKSLKIQGTSYIINERTGSKLGFTKVKTNNIQKLLLIVNYLNLLCSISLVKGKISFPNLKNVHTFEISMDKLIENKEYINRLYQNF